MAIVAPAFRSMAFDDIPVPDFADVQIIPLPQGAPTDPVMWAKEIFSVRNAPVVVKALFGLRQSAVRLVGIPPASREIFEVRKVLGEEALLGVNDTHLNFRAGVAVDVEAGLVRVTTAVRLHGWRGRLYFGAVRVLHGPIAVAMMNRASQTLGAARASR